MSPSGAPAKNLTAHLFSYIHNEFNFNLPRPIARSARISHLVFAPLFTQKTEYDRDPLKRISKITAKTLALLLAKSRQEPNQRNWPKNLQSFRGGRDRIFTFVGELFDFTEPFMTTKRSIIERKKKLLKNCSAEANAITYAFDRRLEQAGPSNRLTNTVEFYAAGPPETKHFRWTRHTRPYQTFTLTHEVPPAAILENKRDPFGTTALHAFPQTLFDDVFGRYVQGANWLIVPVEAFFGQSLTAALSEHKANAMRRLLHAIGITETDERGTLAQALSELSKGESAKVFEELGNRPSEWVRDNSDERIAAMFDVINISPETALKADRLIIAATDAFLRKCFGRDESGDSHIVGEHKHKSEYIGMKCMDGRAYIFANLRNNHSLETHADPSHQSVDDVFTRSVVIDCGMNRFQRGRLIQIMAEFATERTMALLLIARFRLLHSAFNLVESKLNQAISNYHNNKEQLSTREWPDGKPQPEEGPVVPYDYWRDIHRDLLKSLDGRDGRRHKAARERKLIIALKFLSSCLSMLNELVEGGITDRATSTVKAIESLREKLSSVREKPIVGHQTLQDFIQRRFVPAARVIGRTGERYQRLRERISEVAELTNVNLSAEEWHAHQKQAHRQTLLLSVAEFFGEAALCYYTADLLTKSGIVPPVVNALCSIVHASCIGADLLADFYIYPVMAAVMIILWSWSAYRMFRDILEDRGIGFFEMLGEKLKRFPSNESGS